LEFVYYISRQKFALEKAHLFFWPVVVVLSVNYFCQQNDDVLFGLHLIIREIAHDEIINLLS